MSKLREKPALELAINLFRQMINDLDQRYWGTTLIDALFPIIEAFDIETDCTWVISCCALSKLDADVDNLRQHLIEYVSDRYRRGYYVTSVIPALCGSDCRVVEVDWTPSDADRQESERALRERDRRMEQRLLQNIDEALSDEGAKMRRDPICCEVCGCELAGGLDTFGAVGEERCFDCHFGIGDIFDGREMVHEAKYWIDGGVVRGLKKREWMVRRAVTADDRRRALDDLSKYINAHYGDVYDYRQARKFWMR